jgi:hypothetical protein
LSIDEKGFQFFAQQITNPDDLLAALLPEISEMVAGNRSRTKHLLRFHRLLKDNCKHVNMHAT